MADVFALGTIVASMANAHRAYIIERSDIAPGDLVSGEREQIDREAILSSENFWTYLIVVVAWTCVAGFVSYAGWSSFTDWPKKRVMLLALAEDLGNPRSVAASFKGVRTREQKDGSQLEAVVTGEGKSLSIPIAARKDLQLTAGQDVVVYLHRFSDEYHWTPLSRGKYWWEYSLTWLSILLRGAWIVEWV